MVILIVNHDVTARENWKSALKLNAYEVVETSNYKEAVDRIRDPELDIGLDAVHFYEDFEGLQPSVEDLASRQPLPVIFTADCAYPVGAQQGSANLLEPVTSEELLDAVRELLQQST